MIHSADTQQPPIGQNGPPARAKDRLIFDLLHGEAGDDETTVREARAGGLDLAQPRAVVLVDATGYILGPVRGTFHLQEAGGVPRRSRRVVSWIVDFFQLPHDTICAYLGEGDVAILKASNSRNLDAWTRQTDDDDTVNPSWSNLAALKRAAAELLAHLQQMTGTALSIGIGRYHPGTSGLAASYRDAIAALTLGRRLLGPNRVYCLDELGVAAFVGLNDERMKSDLAHYLLSPLDHEPELLLTLETFLSADCSPVAAAERLAIHRNTIGYRLAKVASLTGLDPRRFDDALQIRLALVLRGLAETRDP